MARSVSLATVEHTFCLFGEAIYDRAVEELEALSLPGEQELDGAMFGGHHKGKRGWDGHGQHMVFRTYQRDV